MEENNNKEIENILDEAPVEIKKDEKKVKQSYKPRRSKKKIIIIGGVIILSILIISFIFLQSSNNSEGSSDNCGLDIIKTNQEFVSSMKQQIIDKGYAEVSDGNTILKLIPYN